MNASFAGLIAALAIVIIIGLAVYAWRLWEEVRRREAFKRDEIRRANEQCLESLGVIASAMLLEQIDLTEGALRCKVLLEIIDPSLVERQEFHVFGAVHKQAAHLHTHSARRALTPRERMKEDKQRLEIEARHREPLMEAARAVLDFKTRWPQNLH